MQAIFKKLTASTSITAIAILTSAAPAYAADEKPVVTAWEASRTVDDSDMVTTGVARGRDRLNSATSTSAIKENEITRVAPQSLAELFRNIPGIRVEAGSGEARNSYTVRGLPLVNEGSKYLQIQEDGLPVLEFGDLLSLAPDIFVRADFNVGQVESIRGGSASTFASNAPGGVINLISKTGEVEGGSVMATAGLDFESFRTDFDFGSNLGNGWRFHIGGFYREGDGPRSTGGSSMRGGQVKLNVTKQFNDGYIRVYGKLLDDRFPSFGFSPIQVSGTDSDPKYSNLANFDAKSDTLINANLGTMLRLGASGIPTQSAITDHARSIAKSLGIETQFNIGEWTISNRFRYTDQSSTTNTLFPARVAPALAFAAGTAGPGAALTYAAGPLAGQPFSATGGNGLMSLSVGVLQNAPDMSNMTDDFRLSRVWQVGGGSLTTTAGVYRSSQKYVSEIGFISFFQDVVPNGGSVPLNLTTATGVPITQNGVLVYGSPNGFGNSKNTDLTYTTTAPFGSFNYANGPIAFGGSIRWDNSKASGTIINDSRSRPFDINGNGTVSVTEGRVNFIPTDVRFPVDYDHDYVSYSLSVNYRVAETFAVFARYSRGGRAGADKILFTPAVSTVTGALVNESAGHDTVRQAEVGLKYRNAGITLNLTGFYALTAETNAQVSSDPATNQVRVISVQRNYKAYGAEFEGSLRHGPWSVTANATYTKASIEDAEVAALIGNTPRHQPSLLFRVSPQYDSEAFSIGANLVGATSSYSQDVNQLRMPGYTTVGLFAQYRPMKRFELSVNANNVFNSLAIMDVLDGSRPLTGVTLARTLYARTITTSARFFF